MCQISQELLVNYSPVLVENLEAVSEPGKKEIENGRIKQERSRKRSEQSLLMSGGGLVPSLGLFSRANASRGHVTFAFPCFRDS